MSVSKFEFEAWKSESEAHSEIDNLLSSNFTLNSKKVVRIAGCFSVFAFEQNDTSVLSED